MWHTINCNVLPKDYKEAKVEEDNFQDKKIAMFADGLYPSAFDSEEFAT